MFLMDNSWGLRANGGDAERAFFLQCGISSRSTALCPNVGFNFCYVFLHFNMPHQTVQCSQTEVAFASFGTQLFFCFLFFLLFHIFIWLATDEVVSIFKPEKNPHFWEVNNFINITLYREKLKYNHLLT